MKFFFDNNLSPSLAHGLAALSEPDNITVEHLSDRFDRDTPDVTWIERLGNEGDWAVITKDHVRKNPLEIAALRQARLIVFLLKKTWTKQRRWDIAAGMVRWWPLIMQQADLAAPGSAFEVPYKLSGKGKFTPLRI